MRLLNKFAAVSRFYRRRFRALRKELALLNCLKAEQRSPPAAEAVIPRLTLLYNLPAYCYLIAERRVRGGDGRRAAAWSCRAGAQPPAAPTSFTTTK